MISRVQPNRLNRPAGPIAHALRTELGSGTARASFKDHYTNRRLRGPEAGIGRLDMSFLLLGLTSAGTLVAGTLLVGFAPIIIIPLAITTIIGIGTPLLSRPPAATKTLGVSGGPAVELFTITMEDGSIAEWGTTSKPPLQGGQGVVRQVRRYANKIPVEPAEYGALKLARESADPVQMQDNTNRLHREIETIRDLSTLGNENIIKFLGTGKVAKGSQEILLVEWLDALDNKQLKATLNPAQWVNLFIQIGKALQAANAAGFAHRDVKDSNIIIIRFKGKYIAKLIDWGTTRLTTPRTEASPATLTTTGERIGTPSYLAPEVMKFGWPAIPKDSSHLPDIYAMGLSIINVLCGTHPLSTITDKYVADTRLEQWLQVAKQQIDLFAHNYRDKLEPEVIALVGEMISFEPTDRPQSYEDLLPRLEQLEIELAGRPNRYPKKTTSTGRTDPTPTGTAGSKVTEFEGKGTSIYVPPTITNALLTEILNGTFPLPPKNEDKRVLLHAITEADDSDIIEQTRNDALVFLRIQRRAVPYRTP